MTFKIDKEAILKRSEKTRYLVKEVFPADVPSGVRWAVAGRIVELLVADTSEFITDFEPGFSDYDALTEMDLMKWGSGLTFRQLPEGSWAVLELPTKLGGEHTLGYLVDKPGPSGTRGCLPEIRYIMPEL